MSGSSRSLVWPEPGRVEAARRPKARKAGTAVSADDPHDVAFLHDQQVFAVELDLGAGPLAEQHAVASLHVERGDSADLALGARTDGDDLALARLFVGAVREDDAPGGLFFGFDATDQYAVVQRTKCHWCDLSDKSE